MPLVKAKKPFVFAAANQQVKTPSIAVKAEPDSEEDGADCELELDEEAENSGSQQPVEPGESGPEPSSDGPDELACAELRRVELLCPLVTQIHEHEMQGKFEENGFLQLVSWLAQCMQLLGDSARSDLVEYLSKKPFCDMQIGSACSGSDAPLLVAKAFAAAAKTTLGVTMTVEHKFSCERDRNKQNFLQTLFTNTADAIDMQRLFADTELLSRGPGAEVPEVLSGNEACVPDCSDLFLGLGFPCQDVSKLNPNAAANREVVRHAGARTGKVFADVMKYVRRLQKTLAGAAKWRGMLLENVAGLLDAPKGLNLDTELPFHSNLDYVEAAVRKLEMCLIPFMLEPHMFGQPVSTRLLKRVFIQCLYCLCFPYLQDLW